MKESRSTVRDLPPEAPEPASDPFMDETMAMVYVGDVYSLVAQEAVPGEATAKTSPATDKAKKHDAPGDDHDAVWPFIR